MGLNYLFEIIYLFRIYLKLNQQAMLKNSQRLKLILKFNQILIKKTMIKIVFYNDTS